MRTAWFDKMRPQERFGRQRRPEGVRVREASALETIRLVLPNDKPSPSAGVCRLGARLDETDDRWRQQKLPHPTFIISLQLHPYRFHRETATKIGSDH